VKVPPTDFDREVAKPLPGRDEGGALLICHRLLLPGTAGSLAKRRVILPTKGSDRRAAKKAVASYRFLTLISFMAFFTGKGKGKGTQLGCLGIVK
jgi:hypothetical protein